MRRILAALGPRAVAAIAAPGVTLVLLAMALPGEAATPMPTGATAHTFALHQDGTVRGWGDDRRGEVSIGVDHFVLTPTRVEGLPAIRADSASLAVGSGHALAIAADGTVWGWGANGGNLGDGTTTDRTRPVRALGLSNTVAVATYTHSMAITADGALWGWGGNGAGQLGIGQFDGTFLAPVRTGFTGAAAVAAGSDHTLVLATDGTVFAMGGNAFGQIGDGTTERRATPVRVPGLSGVISVVAGPYHSLAVKADGSVWSWGRNDEGALGDGTMTNRSSPVQLAGFSALKVAAGFGPVTYAIRADGSVWRWGGSAGTQPVLFPGYASVTSLDTGNGFSIARRADGTVHAEGFIYAATPVAVPFSGPVVAVAAGHASLYALQDDGTVYAWGSNSVGQLGSGRTVLNRTTPAALAFLQSVIQIAATGWNLALRSDGTVVQWSHSPAGPETVAALSGIVQVAAGESHGVALKSDGSVWTWGNNTFGQLGRGPFGGASGDTPAVVPGLTASRVAAALKHTVIVRTDGTVWAWGLNRAGELGVTPAANCPNSDGSVAHPCNPAPARVEGISSVVEIAAGERHTLALRSDGSVWAWGENSRGELGDGSTSWRFSPGAVPGIANATQIAASGGASSFSFALKGDGTVWTWGDNSRGQLGGESAPFRTTPKKVEGLSTITRISAGGRHALALRADGVLWAWGANDEGQVGDGTYVDRFRPVIVLREEGAGTVDGNDWYLDIDPTVPNASIPFAATPGMVAVAQRSGSASALGLDATAKFKGVDFGRSVNLYVLAQVPPAFFDQVKLAPGAKTAAELRAKAGDALVLAQLTPQGWTNATGQLIAYSQNVGNAAGAAASILDGINTSTIPGARFCIGYGETAEAMLNSIVLRDVLEVAGASGSASGVPCVLAGVYLGGPAASRLGTPVTFTASVVGLSPTGSVQFFDGAASMSGGVALASANEAVAKASVTTSTLAAGIHGIAASYSGDAQNASVAAANSTPLRHEVSAPPGGTRVDLTGPVSSHLGESVAFTATVTGNNPAGTVQFKDGAANLGGAVPLVGAVAVLSVSSLAAGPHAITAVYSGDGGNAGNTSNALSHTVYASIATKVALGSSANPAAQGTAVTLTATVTGTNPTGSVAFRDGAAVVATVALASGVASTTLSGLGAGLHIIVADYLGDGANPAASSPTLFQQVTAAGATIGAFVARMDVAVSALVTSNAALVTGVGAGQSISVTGGEYSIGCTASFTTAAGTVTDGQRVCVRHTSSASLATTTRTTLVVGTATADFTSTTMTAAFRAGITALVSHYYQAALRRPSDAGGQAYWEAEGLRVHMLGANIAETFYLMAMAFFGSAEYVALNRDNAGYVTDLYTTFFNRAPDAGGLAFWSGQLGSGLPREVLLAHFMFSAEFVAFLADRFGHRPARAEVDLVGDFYRGLLSRLPDSTGFDFWVRRFRTAQCVGAASVVAEVEAISSAFATGGEYAARVRDNTRYVGDLYNAFLRRGGDLGGVQFWIGQLATRTREQLRRDFVASPEFAARVNAVVAQGCL